MSTRKISLVGKTFGRLKVIADATPVKTYSYSVCQCECGAVVVKSNAVLRGGFTKSCGCYRKEFRRLTMTTHGHSIGGATPTLSTWYNMVRRCTNPKDPHYHDYGGRGIMVCDRWKQFENFLEDMGERPPGLTIERRDNNAGYCKENCYWATRKEQQRNRRNSRVITVNGITDCLASLCEVFGKDQNVVRGRLDCGWSTEDAFSKPVKHRII